MTAISVLLPTRGRREVLKTSINSLINSAHAVDDLELLLAFDDDDQDTINWFVEHTLPDLKQLGLKFRVLSWPRMGYARLHDYVNGLAAHAQGHWLVFWNDDAVMQHQGWDTVIKSYTGQFVIQAFDTHKLHPYSIFPIVPRAWYETLGYLSQHPLNDAYISQIAWMLDIMVRIPVQVLHDRFDLTGNNNDSTFQERQYLEGNVKDPRDFNHSTYRHMRISDATKLAAYMNSHAIDTSHWQDVVAGRRDPWAKMLASDVNQQMARF
jgi:glycosyltransferase involved in cell wall biosynthesis